MKNLSQMLGKSKIIAPLVLATALYGCGGGSSGSSGNDNNNSGGNQQEEVIYQVNTPLFAVANTIIGVNN